MSERGMMSSPDSTIHESVSETILRDLRLVGSRLALVMVPGISSERLKAELRDWELWGPLFICMSLAVILSVEAKDAASLVFSIIFVLIWGGAGVVTLNAQLLGGNLSFFQSVCLLGYCVFPILLSSFFCWLWNHVLGSGLAVVLRFVTVVVALIWSNWAASSFMSDTVFPDGRKLLALYPVILFYISLAWMVLIGFQQGIQKSEISDGGGPSPSPTPTIL